MINKEEAKKLFEKECVLIGRNDVITAETVKRLFGSEAYEFAKRINNMQNTNAYGIGDITIEYLTYNGFLSAATFCNIKEIDKIERGVA